MEKWMPLIQKFNGYFETNLKPSKGISVECLDAHTKALVEKYFLSLGFPALHGLYSIYYIPYFIFCSYVVSLIIYIILLN